MAATATILDAATGPNGSGTCRFNGHSSPDLAVGDTVGLTVDGTAHSRVVPAGGESLYAALTALANTIRDHADGHDAQVSKNQDDDICLHVQSGDGTTIALASAVFTIA